MPNNLRGGRHSTVAGPDDFAADPESFSRYVTSFVEGTRTRIRDHHGLFDKFTGDGFIAYFNEAFCSWDRRPRDHVKCFLDFARDERDFVTALFGEWTATLRKVPSTTVGLALGADVGTVHFQDLNDHLVAVGNPIVWASRMASAANGGELLVNNQLYVQLRESPDLRFEPREDRTKAGESFVAQHLRFGRPHKRRRRRIPA